MNEKQMNTMTFGRKMTAAGLFIGFIIFLTGLLVSGASQDNYTIFIGLSIMVTSMLLFGFGLFFMLLQEVTDKRTISKN
jgi:hypothetical protein